MNADHKLHVMTPSGFAIRLERTITEESSTPVNTGGRVQKSKIAKHESRFHSIYDKMVDNVVVNKEQLTPHFVKKMLQKPEKNERDAIILYEYFKDYPFFLQFFDENQDIEEKDAFLYLLKHSNLVSGDMGETIYTEGSVADGNIYIVLKGKVCMIERGTGAGGLNEDQLHLADEDKVNEEEKNPTKSPKKKPQTIGSGMVRLVNRGLSKKNIMDATPGAPKASLSLTKLLLPLDKDQKDGSPNLGKSPAKTPSKNHLTFSKLASRSLNPSPMSNKGAQSPSKSKISALFRWAQLIAGDEKKEKEDYLNENPTVPVLKRQTSFFESITREDFENSATILKYMVEPEEFFGHNIAYDGKRKETAILMEYSDLMILRRDHFNAIFHRFSKKKIRKLNFMIDFIPNIEVIHNNQILENLSTVLTEKRFRYGEYVCHEGKPSDFFYMLAEGRCDVVKTLILNIPTRGGALDNAERLFRGKGNHKEELRLNILERGSFFAEEILTRKDKMVEYTVKVTSSVAIVYAIHRRRFLMRFPKEIIKHVNKILLKKREEKRTMLDSTMKFKRIEFNPTELYIGGPIVKDGRFRKDHHLLHNNSSISKKNRIDEGNNSGSLEAIVNSPSVTPSLMIGDAGGKKIKVSQLLQKVHRKSLGAHSIDEITKLSSQVGHNGSDRNSAILAELDYEDGVTNILTALQSPDSSTGGKKSESSKKHFNEVRSKFGQSKFLVEYENYLQVMRNKYEGVDEILRNQPEKTVEEPKLYNVNEIEGDNNLEKRFRIAKGEKLKQDKTNRNNEDSLLSLSIINNYNKILTRTRSREGKAYIDRSRVSPLDAMLPNLPALNQPDTSALKPKMFYKNSLKPMLLKDGTNNEEDKDSKIRTSSSTDTPRDTPQAVNSKNFNIDQLFVTGGMKSLTSFDFRMSKKSGFLAKRVGGFTTKPMKTGDSPTHKRNLTMPFITSPEILQDLKI